MMLKLSLVVVIAVAQLSFAAPVRAQDYPNKELTLIIPFSAGGGTDVMGRVYAQKLSAKLKQSVVVDNRVGAGSIVGTSAVVRSRPDGYTLLFNGSSLTFHPGLFRSLPYDLKKDLKPVAIIAGQPFVLYVSKDFPANNIQELAKLAKENPGSIPYASVGIGSSGHLATELLFNELGIKMRHVPYKGTPQAMTDLLTGEVKLLYTTITGGLDLLNSGQVKAIGISSLQRSAVLPNMPTVAEQGLPNYQFTSWLAIFVPSSTPDNVVQVLAKATDELLSDPEIRAQFETQGLNVERSTPATAGKFFVEEIDRWTRTIKDVGIEPQ
jgi:tripartite-type tricarboxylate transporter receptor subunit TctC